MERRELLAGLAAMGGLTVAAPAATAADSKPATGLVVEAVQMPAWIGRDGQRQPLSPGDTVSTAQEVETAAGAGLLLKLPEGSLVRLGEKTRLGVQRFEVNAADGRTAVQSELKLFDGFFRTMRSQLRQAR